MLVRNSGNDGLWKAPCALEWDWTANKCCPKTIQGISLHVLLYFLLVGSRACCHCRIAEPQRIRRYQTQPAIPSLSILYPEIAVEGWQMLFQVLQSQHSNTPWVFPSQTFAQCSSLVSPTPSPPAAPLNPLCPSLDPREQDLLMSGTATKPDLHKVGCDHPE